jgi:hypothetical protein
VLLKINKAVLFFVAICFFSMALPYFFEFGDRSLFLKDYYAKRIMTLLSLPFFGLVVFFALKHRPIKLSAKLIVFLIFCLVNFINSVIFKNSPSLIFLDLFIMIIPVFFYLLVFKTEFSVTDFINYFPLFLIISCFLVLLKIKLQFSYFSILGVLYLIFLTKTTTKDFFLLLSLPYLILNTLIGKSASILLLLSVIYFFLFDRNLVAKQKKLYLILIPSAFVILSGVVFWDKIEETGAYKNAKYFLTHSNFSELKFFDMSTSHRIYEAQRVVQEFKKSNVYVKFFGHGFGATIDLSETNDVAVTNSNVNLSSVRHIHIGPMAVLFRYGLLGILVYFIFSYKLISNSIIVLKRSHNYAIVLSALYLLLLLFDSLISFPHMMSNFMFWLIFFVILKEGNKFRSHD